MNAKKVAGALAVASMLLVSGVAFAQTTTTDLTGSSTTSGTSTTTTPGVPNTGAGGDTTANLIVLGASGLVVAAGGTYLLRKKIPQ